MLKKVRIKNFLSCEDTEIEFDPITILIGRNGAGKSNILKTIQALNHHILGNRILSTAIEIGNEIEIEIDFLIDNKKINYLTNLSSENKHLIIKEKLSSDNQVIVNRKGKKAIYLKKEFNINYTASVIKSTISIFPENEIVPLLSYFVNYCQKIEYYTLEIQIEYTLIQIEDYEKWLLDKNNSVQMRLIHSWKEDSELFDEIQELLGKNGLGIINKIVVLDIHNEFYLIKFEVQNTVVLYSQLSYGTQRVLMILLALLYDKNSTLLIEQPEDGIHIGLLRKVLSICFEYAEVYNKQLIITTHSPEVINMFQPENIRLVKMTENGTKVTAFNKEEIPLIHDYLENEGALSDFIKSMNED